MINLITLKNNHTTFLFLAIILAAGSCVSNENEEKATLKKHEVLAAIHPIALWEKSAAKIENDLKNPIDDNEYLQNPSISFYDYSNSK